MRDRKDNTLHVRLTQEERKNLERLAAEKGRKTSAIVRELLFEALIYRAGGVTPPGTINQ